MAEEKKVKCPECGQADGVQKLSVVYAEGMFTSSGTSKVKELRPPDKPKFNGLAEKVARGMGKVVDFTAKYAGCMTGLLVWFALFAIPFVAWAYFSI